MELAHIAPQQCCAGYIVLGSIGLGDNFKRTLNSYTHAHTCTYSDTNLRLREFARNNNKPPGVQVGLRYGHPPRHRLRRPVVALGEHAPFELVIPCLHNNSLFKGGTRNSTTISHWTITTAAYRVGCSGGDGDLN